MYKTYHSSKTKIDLPSFGKWGIVTGCSHGIGRAYAEALARLGLNIVLISSGNNKLRNLANAIESVYNVKTKTIELNFSHEMDAYRLIERETIGLKVGILVNNFGMFYPHPEYFLDLPHKEKIYMKIIQCNVVVVTNMCQIVLSKMVTRGKGIIVNVASSSAVMPSPLMTVFAATKAYVLKFSRDLNIEYNRYGIIVQCLLPGCIINPSAESPQTRWMVPTPDKYVESAIKMIGKEDVTTGFFPHKIFVGFVKALYRLSPNLVNMGMTRIMEGNRNFALRKYIRLSFKGFSPLIKMVESSTVLQDRHYVNPFKDFSKEDKSSPIDFNAKEIHKDFKEKLTEKTIALLRKLEKNKMNWYNKDDQSIYTGLTGIAFVFYHYGKYFEEPTYLSKAAEMVHSCVSNLKSKRQVTFLTGSAGPLALGAVIYDSIDREESEGMIWKLKSLSNNVLEDKSDLPDELLYGRVGYLLSLLFVNSKISPSPIDDDLVKQVVASILKSGRIYSVRKHSKSPLMYAWHDKEYLGAAHGLGGILYLLLQARQYLSQSELKDDIEPSLKYLQKLRFPSGNFPSSVGNESDKLIHWCHGAPSMTMLFSLAYKVFGNKDYLETSIKCGEVIWDRGLLTKGYGICHGVSGNAYSFLNLFQETKDEKHLYRACKFAEWCFDYGSHQNRTPDRPFSLFEGLAGTIYFLIDLQKPMLAKFPAYTL